jgi:hypothetical protein
MAPPRYLCSHLVRLVVSGPREQWVNLEEIWEGGAVLECEDAVDPGIAVTIQAGDLAFSGIVTAVEREESGWRVEMDFSPLTPWTIKRWKPDHILDPATLGREL